MIWVQNMSKTFKIRCLASYLAAFSRGACSYILSHLSRFEKQCSVYTRCIREPLYSPYRWDTHACQLWSICSNRFKSYGHMTVQPDRGSNPGPSAYRAGVLPSEPPGRTVIWFSLVILFLLNPATHTPSRKEFVPNSILRTLHEFLLMI